MIVLEAIDTLKDSTIVTIGKFDGLHLGHQLIVNKINEVKDYSLKSLMVSFTANPTTILSNKPERLLLTNEEKRFKAESLRLDYYIDLPLSEELLNTSAKDFIENYLIDRWNCKILVVGDDFSFGRGREGNIEFLTKNCPKYGIKLIVVERKILEGQAISSSRIKNLLLDGNMSLANKCLGYNYSFKGLIKSGNKLGRTIGFPTINIKPDEGLVIPKYGVYKSYVRIGCLIYKGITNIGVKPTVESSGEVLIETNLLDFEGDIYGHEATVILDEFVRPEMKFNSLEDLKKQIENDKKVWTFEK